MQATPFTLAAILQFQEGNLYHYHVPKYQREYTWGRSNWEQLFLDIEENEVGYFMGSIIAIVDNNKLRPGESPIFEVIDGQQRLITLSIFLMSIYCRLRGLENSLPSEDEQKDHRTALSDIERQLVHKKERIVNEEHGYVRDNSTRPYCFLRVQPSTQNKNLEDYLHILNELKVIDGDFHSRYYGIRKLYKAYCYFYDKLPDNYEELKKIRKKINGLQFIYISVNSSSDAFVLFEALNNRGVPLSAMDIIKNKMLSNLERNHNIDINKAYNEWQKLLTCLPECQDQERFLRQYYNAFKVYPKIKIERFERATKSTLVKIYEELIQRDAKVTLDSLLGKAKTYSSFIAPVSSDLSEKRKNYLLDLDRIGSAPSYLFLLYLCSLPLQHLDERSVIDETLEFLVKYYVRRNITDFPNTRELDAINMEVIENCENCIQKGSKIGSTFIIEKFRNGKGKPSSIKDLKANLEDKLFENNSGMARFVLSKFDEMSHTREYSPNLWARNEKGLLVWTVEHILPQGDSMPQCWVDMIADGDMTKAEDIQKKWVHCLGNLTLTGYNSNLGNSGFENKQNLKTSKSLGHTINIGYKNGLALNNFPFSVAGRNRNLADIEKWTETSIEARNDAMVDELIKLFAFDEAEQNMSVASDREG